jgi:hypothetical protein
MNAKAQSARCPACRAQVLVEERDAHGDQIHCDNCKGAFKVVRRDSAAVRLVYADAGPLRDNLRDVQGRTRLLESELQSAKASLGIGVNGLGLGVLYVVAKVGLENALITRELIWTAVAIAAVTGALLELTNFFFLAKHKAMVRLSGEIREAQREAQRLRQFIRDATRG